jgi:hypothetical protein
VAYLVGDRQQDVERGWRQREEGLDIVAFVGHAEL